MEIEVNNIISARMRDGVSRGERMHQFMTELFPICRSITGNGLRQTLNEIKKVIPIEIQAVPSGTDVFDWQIPKEWNIRGAYIRNMKGETLVDFSRSNLHVMNYSVPVHKVVSLAELKQHLYTLPKYPDWIPYRTSYYNEDWGFCVTYNQYKQLQDDEYEVCIDATLEDGYLNYGEYFRKGETDEEVLISTHVCHPSLCNDNLSGISVATFLAKELENRNLKYSYRFLFIPGTIGAITWLAINEEKSKKIKHGLVAALLGSGTEYVYKRSRIGDAEIDRTVENVLASRGERYRVINFSPYGYDERQFCSPGFNLPVGSLTRARHNEYPEYHTSADNLELVKPYTLETSLKLYQEVIDVLETNARYLNLNPKCEPQLGRRGLYSQHAYNGSKELQLAMLWVLNLSDGDHTLLQISKRSGIAFSIIRNAADKLVEHALLQKLE